MSVLRETKYGFEWRGVFVERCCELYGHRILEIRTPKKVLEVRITPSGLIRTYERKNLTGKADR